MGGQVRLVHITTLNGVSLAWFLAVIARGAGFPLPGVPAPFVYPLGPVVASFARLRRRRCCRFCGPVFSLCCLAGGYAPPIGIAPAFLDSLCARYAQCRILCSRLCQLVCASHGAALSCGSRCGVWGFHVWVLGSSGVLLGCERGRAGGTLASFFEAATMPEQSAAHQGRGQAHLRVLLNDRTIRHHRVNAGANKRETQKQGEAATCR